MAGLRTCRTPHRNLPLGGEDELIKGPPRAFIKSNNICSPFPDVF